MEQEQKALKTLKEFERNQAEYNLVVMELSNLVKLNLEELSEGEVNKQIEKANKRKAIADERIKKAKGEN